MIIISCPCGKALTAKPEWAGIAIRCAGCGRAHYVAEGAAAAPPPAPAVEIVDDAQPTKACPLCGESIKVAAIKCRHCGEFLDRRAPAAAAAVDPGGVGILILAIVSWMFLCNLASPIAWVMGASYETTCRARGVEPSGAGKAARILGMIGTILMIAGLGVFVLAALAGSA